MSNSLESTETFNTKELHDLCNSVTYDNKEGGFDRIRQWLHTNKDDNDRMKAAMTYQGKSKHTPLHRLLCRYHQLDIIQTFIKFLPEVVNMKDRSGSLPIHDACLFIASLEVIQALITASPDSIKIEDNDGRLPLHRACWSGASLNVLNLLIESYPEGIDHKNRFGQTPLLILKQKKYAEKKDDNDMLPLHNACNNGYSLHLIHFLIQAFPESTTVQDNNGNTPLQYLTITASRVDENGMLLLHRQAAHCEGLSFESLNILFDAYSEAIRIQDNFGLLPLHYACLNEVSTVDIIMSLVKLSPESILVRCTSD
jgi:ankyrin repeat protein